MSSKAQNNSNPIDVNSADDNTPGQHDHENSRGDKNRGSRKPPTKNREPRIFHHGVKSSHRGGNRGANHSRNTPTIEQSFRKPRMFPRGGYSRSRGRDGNRGANHPKYRPPTEQYYQDQALQYNRDESWYHDRDGHRGSNPSLNRLPTERYYQVQAFQYNRDESWYNDRDEHRGSNTSLNRLPTERYYQDQAFQYNRDDSWCHNRGGNRGSNPSFNRIPIEQDNWESEMLYPEGYSRSCGRGGNRGENQSRNAPTIERRFRKPGMQHSGCYSGSRGRGGNRESSLSKYRPPTEQYYPDQALQYNRDESWYHYSCGNRGSNPPLNRLPTERNYPDQASQYNRDESWHHGRGGNRGSNQTLNRPSTEWSDLNPGIQDGRKSDVLTCERMNDYEKMGPAIILLSLGHEKSGLQELLYLTNPNAAMVKLTVSVLAKGFKCDTAPQNKINILTKLIDSPFLTIAVPDLLTETSFNPSEVNEESQKIFMDVCQIVLALYLYIPSTCFNMNLLDVTSVIERSLRERSDVDDELMKIFHTIQELRDKRLATAENTALPDEERDVFFDGFAPSDFRHMSLIPTLDDIDPSTKPFLRKNKITGGYASTNDYLDVQFRLLREDFIQPLRNGIGEYQRMVRGENIGHRLSDIRVYNNVSIVRSICTSTDLLYRLQFDVSKKNRVNWQNSKRLIFGSLICLSSDNFQTVYFATVGNRDVDNVSHGYIDVQFEHEVHEIVAIPTDQRFVMVETTAFYEAYKHVLKGLQEIETIPFERYIVQSTPTVNPPRYLVENPHFDLRPLVDDAVKLRGDDDKLRRQGRKPNYDFSSKSQSVEKVNLLSEQSSIDHELLNLDESQCAALQTALTKEFSVIQGPPGTGKTYVGLKIVKALLHNSEAWNYDGNNKRPMLIVCYTNHALDQFLEGIDSFYNGKIVRVGGRISSKNIEKYSLHSQRTLINATPHSKDLRVLNDKNYKEIQNLHMHIECIGQRIEAATRDILTEDVLTCAMSPAHRTQLSSYCDKYGNPIAPESGQQMAEWLCIVIKGRIKAELINNDYPEGEDTENDEEGKECEFMRNDRSLHVDGEGLGTDRHLQRVKEESARYRKQAIAFDVTNIDDTSNSNDGFQLSRHARRTLKHKLHTKLNQGSKMTPREAERVYNIWRLNLTSRWRLYRYWISQYVTNLKAKVTELSELYKAKCETKKEITRLKDKMILTQATVIAMTTTGAGRYRNTLEEVNPRIIVVEEAAEVLEGHIVTSLTSGCEQLILIGDHKQLRPNPNVYNLAVHYKLQISLFERMLKTGVHCDCLEIQHRMRPEISKLMKPIYPTLKDHSSVISFEIVKGLAKNIFFIDHKEEEQHNEEIRSHSNSYEAKYISKLADYLLKQGYKTNQITVLTAYSGQIVQLRKDMPKPRFLGMRITPVDNFQGEENDIILLSLVRSNIKESIGFLRIENRICVALSRARKGLFVIGNFGILASQSPLWKEMANILKKSDELGANLLLRCQNHPGDDGIEITKPQDFEKAPEGGCQKLCNARIKCGHSCTMSCHPVDPEHELYKCPKPCNKTCEDGHPCPLKCHEGCRDCETIVEKIMPDCGHTESIKCHVPVLEHKCTHPCEKTLDCGHHCGNICGLPCQCHTVIQKTWPCGHTGDIKCRERGSAVCSQPCETLLECGHLCSGTCSKCFSSRLHKPCGQKCFKSLICDHICQSECSYCPPCKKECENQCEHSKCQLSCGEICVKCIEPCAWQCQHYKCGKECSEPCDRSACNEPCQKKLDCGHECIGLCGEPCPNLCKICHKDDVTEIFFGTEDEDDARFVQLKDCGHVIEYKSLDKWMNHDTSSSETMSIQMKACPRCKTPIRRCVRYMAIINRLLQSIDEVKQTYIGNETDMDTLRKELQQKEVLAKSSYTKESILALRTLIPEASTENQLIAIQNQIEFLDKMDNLFHKHDQISKNNRLKIYQKTTENILREFKEFVAWLSFKRTVFSNQEMNDAQAELKRLSLFLNFLYLCITIKEKKVDTDLLKEDRRRCRKLFTQGYQLTEEHLLMIRKTLKELEKWTQAPGLGISEEERAMVVKAMGFRRGHWYKCRNGHPYAIGDCGGANQESVCPVCQDKIGGTQHRLQEGNTVATEMDGATYGAWSEQANLENYQFDAEF